jgi:hypothetical protein
MRTVPRLRSALLLALTALACSAAPAGAWTNPMVISGGTGDAFLAAAADPSGEGFAVFQGGTADDPAFLSERRPIRDPISPRPLLNWNGAEPLPGGVHRFTTDGEQIDLATAAAAGQGAGAIVLRYRTASLSRVATLVREPPFLFGDPVTIRGSEFSQVSPPSVAIADNAEAVVIFGGQQGRERRVLLAYRGPGASFTRARTLVRGTRADGARPVAATGPDGWPVVAWVGGRSAYATRLDPQGRVYPVQRLEAARAGSPVSAAVGRTGDAIVAWIDDENQVRVVRRMAPRRFSLSLPVRGVGGAQISGLATAVDRNGRAFVSWRETAGGTSKILLAYAAAGASFRVATLGQGPQIGPPSLEARPDGGAAVAWASPTGFQVSYAAATGKFGTPSGVSAQQIPPDPVNTRGLLLTGPGPLLELLWRQPLEEGGEALVQSSDGGAPPSS